MKAAKSVVLINTDKNETISQKNIIHALWKTTWKKTKGYRE